MRPLIVLIFSLLLVVTALPAQAQSGTIADIIDGREDLSIMSAFLEATRTDIALIYDRAGTLTVFAPDNTAFNNLASALDVTLQDLLQNPEVVTQLMQYHTLNIVNNEAQIRRLNGQLVPTTLRGAFISVRTNADNQITLNNVVEVTETNINASNGVVHIVNDVMLNRVITRTLNSSQAEQLITPNINRRPTVTSTPTTEPTPTPSPTATPSVTIANLRVAHLLPDTSAVDIYIEDEKRFTELEYANLSDFISLRPGTYSLTIVESGEDLDEAITENIDIVLEDGDFALLTLLPSSDDEVTQTLIALALPDLDDDMAHLFVLHAVQAASAVDVLIDDEVIVSAIAYGQNSSQTVEAASVNLSLVETETEAILLDVDDAIDLEAQTYYFVIVYENDGETELLLDSLDADEFAGLQQGEKLDEEPTVNIVNPENEDDLDIVDRLLDADNFTILVDALQAADEEILNRLRGRRGEPVTLLAPTDAAFEDLLSTLELSLEQLLDNEDLVTDVLLYHIVEGTVTSSDLRAAAGTSIITNLPENEAFFVSVADDGALQLNGVVRFTQTDIEANNGIIHVIDEVLLPQDILETFGL